MPLNSTLLRRRELLVLGAGAVALPPAWAWQSNRWLFGSPARLLGSDRLATAEAEVWAGLAAMNQRWNAWKPGELVTLNQALRAGRRHTVAPALAQMIRDSTRLEALSGGLFNPALGALVSAWGFHADRLGDAPAPPPAQLHRWRASAPSLAQLRWDGSALSSQNPAVQLDFGAYAKGVALDWALDRLQASGQTAALLDLGGNLAAMGEMEGRPWRVGLRDPHGTGLLATLQIAGREAVVTSGTYERWRQAGAERVAHVFDPRSGRSAMALASVTVMHPSAALADAAATALLVAGPAGWRQAARRLHIDLACVVSAEGAVSCTPPMAARLQRPT